jgi:hypothetical protein
MNVRRKSILISLAVALVAPSSAIAAVPFPLNDPMPTTEIRGYTPWSHGTDYILGQMNLSSRYASFSQLKGHMDLKLWGVEPYKETDDLSGAQIFHVLNGKEFFEKNKRPNSFCPSQVNWLVIHKMNDPYPYAVPEEVRIFLLEADDIFQLNWNKHLCSAHTYLLDTFKEYPHLPGWDELLPLIRGVDPVQEDISFLRSPGDQPRLNFSSGAIESGKLICRRSVVSRVQLRWQPGSCKRARTYIEYK